MNIEAFGYSVMASVLGISIVFISLVGLSLLMVLLKVLFGDKEKKPASVEVAASSGNTGAGAVAKENNDWIMAAVAAYLMEEDGVAPSALSWGPQVGEPTDPWINNAAFDTKLV